jgi:metal-responsive CopG/Arc/MetJ family transcriptional regulator
MGRIIFSTSLTAELFEKLEVKRGLVPRSTFIEHIITNFLEEQDGARRGTDIPEQKD